MQAGLGPTLCCLLQTSVIVVLSTVNFYLIHKTNDNYSLN